MWLEYAMVIIMNERKKKRFSYKLNIIIWFYVEDDASAQPKKTIFFVLQSNPLQTYNRPNRDRLSETSSWRANNWPGIESMRPKMNKKFCGISGMKFNLFLFRHVAVVNMFLYRFWVHYAVLKEIIVLFIDRWTSAKKNSVDNVEPMLLDMIWISHSQRG
jgi:hypothetical protein